LHAPQEAFDRTNPGVYHMSDVEMRDAVYLTLNAKQMGVGGDNSWGARPLAKYRIPLSDMHFEYLVIPIGPDDHYWEIYR